MSARTARIAAALLLLGLPLASGWLAGFPAGFAELPPRTVYVHPPGFWWPVCTLFTVALIAAVAFLAAPGCFGFRRNDEPVLSTFEWGLTPGAGSPFPASGWIGAALVAVGWAVAWSHPVWLGHLADHSFIPLWLGYVLVMDGLAYRRAGSSPLHGRAAAWMMWFPASALAWWYFELLNRFTQSWIYLGVQDFSTLRYLLTSTLAYSTVMPAVLTTAAWLSTFDYFRRDFVRPAAEVRRGRGGGWWWTTAAGALGLALLPWFPVLLFPVVWVAPLLILTGLLESAGMSTGAGHMLRGDWRPLVTLAAAAVLCGFFWELWNIYALPKWIYQIPWLGRFKLFEMPVVGYLGYLPFGATCWTFRLLLLPAPPRMSTAAADNGRE